MTGGHMSDAHSGSLSPPGLCSTHAFIEGVDRESIITIALSTRRKTLPLGSLDVDMHCTLNPNVESGTYNAVWFINFDDGVQWVFRTPFEDWSPAFERRFQSDIWTMQLIQSRTLVPIPRIVDFSVSQDNHFGRPYLILERVKGVPLYKLWFDPTWFTDEKRKIVFRSLISTMSQLQKMEFTQIGSIYYEEGGYVVGPLLPLYRAIADGQTDSRGPYNSVHSFLMDTVALSPLPTMAKPGLRLLSGCIPDERLDGPPFVLSMPDYNFQNIYVDDDGNVTGLLDWDDVFVGPREAGYARYPLWLSRDIYEDFDSYNFRLAAWDCIPFPPREEIQEDWPEFLPGYRAEFLETLKELNPSGVAPCKYSHLVAPLVQEVSDVVHWGRVKYNLFQYMFLTYDIRSSGILNAVAFERGVQRGEWIQQFTQ